MSRARPRTPVTAAPSRERIYEILRAPVVTEKSTLGSEHNQVTFRVPLDASKPIATWNRSADLSLGSL
jgi:large subunit ribosomal protein L23